MQKTGNKTTKGSRNPELGVMQQPKITQQQYHERSSSVRAKCGSLLHILDVPRLQKEEQDLHNDIDFVITTSTQESFPILKGIFPDSESLINGTCISMAIDETQVDFIYAEHPRMGAMFYTNSFSLPVCFLVRGTPFILTTTGLHLKTRFSANFVLSQDPERVCAFFGITYEGLRAVRYADELFALLSTSWLYDSKKILDVSEEEKNMKRDLMKKFRAFCVAHPAAATLPSEEASIDFFDCQEAYQAFTAEETEKARLEAIRKERETKQAAVKKQLSIEIAAKGVKGKEVGTMFDSFKTWVGDNKGMTYEEWAQTEPDVAVAFKEFNP
jgi:hypothetical protein